MDPFDKLNWATKICHAQFPYFALVNDWGDKRQHIAMYQADLPGLVRAYGDKKTQLHENKPELFELDPMPGLRLASACEGIANTIYGLCDIVASFANKASRGQIPSSFNKIQKYIRNGRLDQGLFCGTSDLEWYARIREIRTEWAHHSTIFIGEDDSGPILVVKPLRRQSDKVYLPKTELLRVQDLIDWSSRAVRSADRFGLEVYLRFVLPNLDLEHEVFDLARDKSGFPIPLDGGGLKGHKISIEGYLKQHKVID
ncbi:MAG: hypothetical protein ACI9VS_002982 [Candidatus Binatia bacterium]|jgi:hypothetical protein